MFYTGVLNPGKNSRVVRTTEMIEHIATYTKTFLTSSLLTSKKNLKTRRQSNLTVTEHTGVSSRVKKSTTNQCSLNDFQSFSYETTRSFRRDVVIPSTFSGNILTIRKRQHMTLLFRGFDILCQVLGMEALTRREVSKITVTDKRTGHLQSVQIVGQFFLKFRYH